MGILVSSKLSGAKSSILQNEAKDSKSYILISEIS